MKDHFLACQKFHKACAEHHGALAESYEAKSAEDSELLKRANRQLHEHHAAMQKLHAAHADHFKSMADAEKELNDKTLTASAIVDELAKRFGSTLIPSNVHGVLTDVPGLTPVARHGGAPIAKAVEVAPELADMVEE
jgi:hypothetical protein